MLYDYNIKDENFIGVLKRTPGGKWQDPKKQGRYPVWIPELMKLGGLNTIWVWNWVDQAQYSTFIRPSSGEKLSEGRHYPLIEGQRVLVSFIDDHMQTGYIKAVLPNKVKVPLDPVKNRDPMYLTEKTEKETWRFTHDKWKYYHHLHGGGRNNFTIEGHNEDKMGRITMQVSHPLNDGINGVKPISTIEIQDYHIAVELRDAKTLKPKHKAVVDSSGILLDVFTSDSTIKMDSEGIRAETNHSIYILAENNIDIIAQKQLKMQGKEETHICGNIVRITGFQQLCLSSTVIVSEAVLTNHMKSGLVSEVQSNAKVKVNAPVIQEEAEMNFAMCGPMTSIKAEVLAADTSLTALNGSLVATDAMEMVAMGVASGTSPGVVNANKGINVAIDAAATAATAAVGNNDVGSGVASAAMVEAVVPCNATCPDEKSRFEDKKTYGNHVSPKVAKIRKPSEKQDKKQAVDEIKEICNGGSI